MKRFIKAKLKLLIKTFGLELRRYNPISSKNLRIQKLFSTYKFDTVIDVGSHEGIFVRYMRECGFAGRIISFEPLSHAHSKLIEYSKRDKNWIIAPRMALGNQNGKKSINVAANFTSSSLLEMEETHLIGSPMSKYISSETVDIYKLDTAANKYIMNGNIVFLKLDVQGYEFEVLEGAQNILPKIIGLQIEMSLEPLYKNQILFYEMLSYLRDLGFELFDIEPCFRDQSTGKLLQFDGIFIRKN